MRFKSIFFVAALAGIMVSCQKSDPEPTPVSKTKYTVLIYGAGGGDLDGAFVNHFSEVAKDGPTANSTMAAQFNYSERMQYHHPDFKGTFRYVLTGKCDAGSPPSFKKQDTLANWNYAETAMKKMIGENAVRSEKISETSIPLYKADNLKAFLDWAADTYPADKYILCLWNHGGGWISEDEEYKGVIFDENNDYKCLSAVQTAVAIRSSKISGKIDAVYYDACNMACVENISELVGYTKYCLASCCPVPARGGDYPTLLKSLESNSEDLPEALKTLCKQNVGTRWHQEGYNNYEDASLWDVNAFGNIFSPLKTVAELVTADYDANKTYYNNVIGKVRLLDNDVKKDAKENPTDTLKLNSGQLPGFLNLLSQEDCPNSSVKNAAATALTSLDNARLYSHYGDAIDTEEYVWCGVTITNNDLYSKRYKAHPGSFDNSVFFNKTGWNKMFKKFEVRMTNKNPCFSY